jgi:hypothetical protein
MQEKPSAPAALVALLVDVVAVPENVCAPDPADPLLLEEAPVDVRSWVLAPTEADLVAGAPVPLKAGV